MDLEQNQIELASQDIIAVIILGRDVGISYYSEGKNTIFTDGVRVPLDEMTDFFVSLKLSCHPTLFILHPKIIANESLLQLIVAGVEGTPDFYKYKVVKSSGWSCELSMEILCNRVVFNGFRENNIGVHDAFLRVSSMIDIDNAASLSSLAALLLHLQAEVFNLEGGQIYINSLSQLSLSTYMRLSMDTLKALQIFKEDYHPNLIKGYSASNNKEGFSIFGLFDRTRSVVGKEFLRDWMARPLFDYNKILDRQLGIELMMRSENQDFVQAIYKVLPKFHDMMKITLRIKKVLSTYRDWCKLLQSSSASLQILDLVKKFLHQCRNKTDQSFLANLFQRIDASSIQSIYVILSDAIDVDATMDNQTVCIRDGYLDQLDRLRRIYSGLEDVLTDAAKKILQESPLLNHVAVEYVPQIGYLAVVEADEANLLDSSIFTFVYELDGRGYYKCATVYEMDETIGDIKGMIADLQKSILVNIEERILDAENQILELYVACGALDATLSLATVAKEMNFVKPEISEDNVIIIKNGRHPLQELTVDSFIPNDTYVSCEENVAIITGENGSGKSVYVKQVGLLVYLAHIGSFLPCEHAVIGLTDKILTRISSIESSCNPHSAFSMDLSQMKHIIGSNTSRSLCLIDEFGKGTSPTDGMALLAACILHFATLKCKAFFILHFTEIFDPQIINLKQWANIQVFKMEVYEAKDSQRGISAGEDKNLSLSDDYAVPLFKLHVGISKSSGALNCARVAGVKQSVLDRAAQILNCLVTKQTIPRPDGDTQSKPRFGGSTPGGDALRIFLSKDAAAWANASDTEVREIMNLLSKS